MTSKVGLTLRVQGQAELACALKGDNSLTAGLTAGLSHPPSCHRKG